MENTKNIASSSVSESSDKVCKSCKKVFDECRILKHCVFFSRARAKIPECCHWGKSIVALHSVNCEVFRNGHSQAGDICASQAKVAPTICRSPPLLSGSSGEGTTQAKDQTQHHPT